MYHVPCPCAVYRVHVPCPCAVPMSMSMFRVPWRRRQRLISCYHPYPYPYPYPYPHPYPHP
jgi:hypothetical protein